MLKKRAKLLAHDWLSGCLATAYAIEKRLPKISCNNGVSFDLVAEEYIEESKDKRKRNEKRKAGNTGRTFPKSERMKETSQQI